MKPARCELPEARRSCHHSLPSVAALAILKQSSRAASSIESIPPGTSAGLQIPKMKLDRPLLTGSPPAAIERVKVLAVNHLLNSQSRRFNGVSLIFNKTHSLCTHRTLVMAAQQPCFDALTPSLS